MNYLKALFVISSILLSSCCNQYSKNTPDSENSSEQQPANLMKQQPQENLSPGTAKILGTVKALPDTGNYITLTIKSVLGYGMATRPIAPGSEIEVYLSEDLREKLTENNVKKGADINIILSQEQAMGSQNPKWQAIQIE